MPTCVQCNRPRTEDDVDYDPLQVILARPLGWYSHPDGTEMCGNCMADIIRNQ